jgi:predicted nucleic acid-binding protein
MIDKKTSLYLDTSIFGGYFDDIFLQDTRLLFEKIKSGKYKVFISSTTRKELANAPERVKNLLKELDYELIKVIPEYEALAGEYIKEKVVGKTSKDDCVHIATATINNIDVLVSWNFKHIVNIERMKGYNSVNVKHGYRHLEIHSPKDLGIYD